MSAPIIYFERVPVFNFVPGVIHLQLAAGISEKTGARAIEARDITVAHLRCNLIAARALVETLSRAIEEHEKAAQKAKDESSETSPQKPN